MVKIFNIITRVVVLNRIEALNIIFFKIGKTPILVSLVISRVTVLGIFFAIVANVKFE